jgi:ubiquinone/menaquinone biosynthesis C-methylase UbiE
MSIANSLYRNGQVYDAMNDALVADTQFYLEELKNERGEVLELACGTGRMTCALAKTGKSMTGVDLSETMLETARQKSSSMNLKIDWHLGNMTNFNLNKKFDVIFVGYNSVHHILTNQDLKSFLESVKNHLKPNGRFLFDIFNPSLELLNRKNIRSEMDDYVDPDTKDPIFVTEENWYDAATQINHITYFYSKKDHPDFHSHPLKMRCYFPQEIDALLNYNGFEIIKKFGSFKKDAFVSHSMKQIFECSIQKL